MFKKRNPSLQEAEMDVHLGNTKGQVFSIDVTSIRNGYSEKTLITSEGEMTIQVPRDRQGRILSCDHS
ncbi:MAG: transposase [Saprospiraceae bacterium]|nr:transposase [Saprospiraceae bacterium]